MDRQLTGLTFCHRDSPYAKSAVNTCYWGLAFESLKRPWTYSVVNLLRVSKCSNRLAEQNNGMKIWHPSRTPERRRQTDSQHLEVIQGGINICLRSGISVRSDGNLAWPFHLFMLRFLIQYLVKGIVIPQMKTLASFTRPCHSKLSFVLTLFCGKQKSI